MGAVHFDVTFDRSHSETAVRKAAIHLLPLLALGYGIAFMDRVNIGFAALQMNADLHFSATVYGLGGGLFFVSYALLEVPSNLMLVRFGARRSGNCNRAVTQAKAGTEPRHYSKLATNH